MIEVSRVSQWLETHIEGLRGPFEFNMIAGGRSNITYRVVDSAGKQVVLRRPLFFFKQKTAYDMELYDTKGRRVWRYMYGELLTDSDSLVVEHSLLLPSPTKEETELFNSVFPLDDEIATPPDSPRGWQVTLRRFFGF